MIGASPPSLRERKKAKTRKVLADTATELFAEQGFDHTTVEAIAGKVKASDYRFSALVMEVVKSKPFQMQSVEGAKP